MIEDVVIWGILNYVYCKPEEVEYINHGFDQIFSIRTTDIIAHGEQDYANRYSFSNPPITQSNSFCQLRLGHCQPGLCG